jgi:uncharacterized coiled-coil protein SlyX
MSSPDLNTRLVKIESHLAELEHMVDRLNEVIREQDKQLRFLGKSHKQLTEKIAGFELDQVHRRNDPPPHYGKH